MPAEVRQVVDNELELVNQLTAIEAEAFGSGGLNEWGLAPMIHHGAVYIIELDNQPVGIAEYMRDMEKEKTAYLYGLAVAEEYRGRGFGKQLLQESMQEIKQKGIDRIELTVDPVNERARELYSRFGFEQEEYRVDEYGAGEDRLIMVCKL